MQKIYKLSPALKDNIWGGNKLRGYGKEIGRASCRERV